jgi:hypothetical protein
MELCAPGVSLAVRLVVKELWVDAFIPANSGTR